MSQSDKILDIVSLGGNLSLQEIMAIYRGKWGNIELSSVSARVNKLKEEGQLKEDNPRKCSITDRVVNPVTLNKCNHDKYRGKNWMSHPAAMKDPNICHIGMIVQECEDCGMDISKYKRVPVKTADEYMAGFNIAKDTKKRRGRRG